MSLESKVQDRIAASRLIELTNPNDPPATTINAARLTAAANDAKGEFQLHTGVTWDEANLTHVALGVTGTVCYLHRRIGNVMAEQSPDCREWEKGLETLQKKIQHARAPSKTSSVMQPSPEQVGDEIVRPAFDRTTFAGINPLRPG